MNILEDTNLKTANGLIDQFLAACEELNFCADAEVDHYELTSAADRYAIEVFHDLLDKRALEFSCVDSMLAYVNAAVLQAMALGLRWFETFSLIQEVQDKGTGGVDLTNRERLEKTFQEAQAQHKLRLTEEIEDTRKKIAEAQQQQEQARKELDRLLSIENKV